MIPLSRNWGTIASDAPTEPSEVTGKAMASGDVKPNIGSITKDSFAPTQGKKPTPSNAAPVYQLSPGP